MKIKTSNCLVAVAILACIFQLFWFGPKCIHGIDYDGMAYTGIARHLRQAEFHSAINAFRSPLLSWIIAAVSFTGWGFVLTGKLVNIASFLLCFSLLYLFTQSLWNSHAAAAGAVAIFAVGRGLAVAAVAFVVPDFLFAALVLLYFIVLLKCLRGGGWRNWFYLGTVHGLAYLAKAFALPWLALCTLVAVSLSIGSLRQRALRLALAAIMPIVVAGGWAGVLHSKYGVFTTGSQFKTNLLQWTLKAYRDHHDPTYALLADATKQVDEYVVDDPMPPGSWPWTYRVSLKQALPKLALAEAHNVPQVLKEITILATPGGLIAFVAAIAIVARRRHRYPVEWRLAAIVAVSAVSLVGAYSMLVFDSRYLYPLIPLVLAVAARFLIPEAEWNHNGWRIIAVGLVVLGTITSVAYSSSPFRTISRDFQAACYDAGRRLRAHDGSRVVSIGSGPFPEHGVGWEAGYKAAYFGNRKLVAALEDLPRPALTPVILTDITKAAPDAVVVWGDVKNISYASFVKALALQYPGAVSEGISDPVLGSVGIAFFLDGVKAANPTPASFAR